MRLLSYKPNRIRNSPHRVKPERGTRNKATGDKPDKDL